MDHTETQVTIQRLKGVNILGHYSIVSEFLYRMCCLFCIECVLHRHYSIVSEFPGALNYDAVHHLWRTHSIQNRQHILYRNSETLLSFQAH